MNNLSPKINLTLQYRPSTVYMFDIKKSSSDLSLVKSGSGLCSEY